MAYNIMQDRDLIYCLAMLHPKVRVAYHPDQEADQVMYTIAKKAERKGDSVVIYSGDDDMLQTLSPAVSIYRGKDKGVKKVITYESYLEDPRMIDKYKKVPVEKLPEYRSLVGDSSDNLKVLHRFPKELAVYFAMHLNFEAEDFMREVLDVYKECDVKKTSYQDHVGALVFYAKQIIDNYKIMKLVEAPVFNKTFPEDGRALETMEDLKLNKWRTFIKEEGII